MTQNGLKWILNTTLKNATFFLMKASLNDFKPLLYDFYIGIAQLTVLESFRQFLTVFDSF